MNPNEIYFLPIFKLLHLLSVTIAVIATATFQNLGKKLRLFEFNSDLKIEIHTFAAVTTSDGGKPELFQNPGFGSNPNPNMNYSSNSRVILSSLFPTWTYWCLIAYCVHKASFCRKQQAIWNHMIIIVELLSLVAVRKLWEKGITIVYSILLWKVDCYLKILKQRKN